MWWVKAGSSYKVKTIPRTRMLRRVTEEGEKQAAGMGWDKAGSKYGMGKLTRRKRLKRARQKSRQYVPEGGG
jgi:hypothetical protein